MVHVDETLEVHHNYGNQAENCTLKHFLEKWALSSALSWLALSQLVGRDLCWDFLAVQLQIRSAEAAVVVAVVEAATELEVVLEQVLVVNGFQAKQKAIHQMVIESRHYNQLILLC